MINNKSINSLFAIIAAVAILALFIAARPSIAEQPETQGFAAREPMSADQATPQPEPHAPFNQAVAEVESYFTPISSELGSTLSVPVGSAAGLRPGMRMGVLRRGQPFTHPITGQVVGAAETRVGTVEVLGAGEASGSLKVVHGEALAGDVVRIPSLRVRVLFFQSEDFDWDLSEEYYFWLKSSTRFDVIDTAPAAASDAEVAARARSLDAEIAIKLEPIAMSPRPRFLQKVIWAEDGSLLLSREISVTEASYKTAKLGEEYFKPGAGIGMTEITIPYSVDLMALGDLDCDGSDEMVLSAGSSLLIYKADATLNPWLGGREPQQIAGQKNKRFIWLDLADLDSDGCAEVIATARGERDDIESYVYKRKSGAEFDLIWKAGYFVRALNGALIGQRFDGFNVGYRAEPFLVDIKSDPSEGAQLALPVKGVGLYGFIPLGEAGQARFYAAYDASNKLALYDSSGMLLWSSPESLGRPARFFTHGEGGTARNWSVPDRLIYTGARALSISKTFWAESAKGLGVKSSNIMGLSEPGASPSFEPAIKDVPDEVLDMGISKGMLFVLSNSYSMSFENLIKGRTLFRTKLFIYKTEL